MTGCGKFSGGSEKISGPSEIFSGSEGTGKNPLPLNVKKNTGCDTPSMPQCHLSAAEITNA